MDLTDPNMVLIMNALATIAKEPATEMVKDAYHGLRDLISRKLHGKPKAQEALAKYEEEPEAWEEPLRAELIEVGAPNDPEIVRAAKELLDRFQSSQITASQFNNQFMGNVGGVVQGNQANVTMNFGEKQPEK